MLAALSATTVLAFPARGRADVPAKVTFEISNETGAPFQTYFKSLGDRYSMPTPAKRTSEAELPASGIVLIMFESGSHGEKKRAFGVNIPADAGAKHRIKLVTRSEPKGVYIATADGADSIYEISLIVYLNS